MSLDSNDACLLELEDFNLYEEDSPDHAISRADRHCLLGGKKMEAEKRIRREIANSNERRRMQSINAGFQALRTLLPRHEGEKLSKAAILQQTAEYIYSLEQEKTRLLSQNCQLKRLLNQHEGGEIPLKKRKSEIITHAPSVIPDSTEDTCTRSPDAVAVIAVSGLVPKKESGDGELLAQLERERHLRRLLEERLSALEIQIYPESREVSHTVVHYEETEATEGKIEVKETEILGDIPQIVESPPAPLLEAAIKAEPRVEVEVLPDANHDQDQPSRLYLASTSRQNLETIVEAIRHLEGDHLFGEEGGEVPLALTKKPEVVAPQRPGVIVVKHS